MGHGQYPCGGTNRRAFLASATLAAVPSLLGASRIATAQAGEPAARPRGASGTLGIPGPYPGRVVEVRNPAMIRDGVKNREAIKTAVDRGMVGLTGADDAVSAWRTFFEPGDVVGIKMNPVGNPLANSSSELMLEVIDGLKAAGVKTRDIVVFERYREEFIGAKMHEAVPDGITWGGLSQKYDESQLLLRWDGQDEVAGYDPDEFIELELVAKNADPRDDRTRRSHLGLLVTRRVNKMVLLPVLKDHGSAGITGALKNMSHGLVNNVARSHSGHDMNVCNQFIPQVVTHPILRKKCVLQILDGIRGVYQRGPFGGDPKFVWEYNGLFFATDPVAMDRVEWQIIDAERKKRGLPPVAATGKSGIDPFGTEAFDMRQPQHVSLCGSLGLGVANPSKIDHKVISV